MFLINAEKSITSVSNNGGDEEKIVGILAEKSIGLLLLDVGDELVISMLPVRLGKLLKRHSSVELVAVVTAFLTER